MGSRRAVVRHRGGVGRRLVVIGGLATFVVGVYVIVVLGGGLLIGRTDSPGPLLSVLATVAVALLFAPAQTALEGVAGRLGHPPTATPYEVLSRFSGAVADGYASQDLPARMAMVLAQGTGAQWAQVWLDVSDRLTLAATWPKDADAGADAPLLRADGADGTGAGRRAVAVRHGGLQLGVLAVQQRRGVALTAVEERLFTGLAAQAGLMLRLVALRAELEDRHGELALRADDLRASRQRLIGTQDAERRRLERDIHDGAQQHLVALTVNLRLAQTIAIRSPERATRLLAEQADAADVTIETLTSLSRGIYPRLLADEGLVPALRFAVATGAIPVTVEATTAQRPTEAAEAALYFACMEAVQNATKHSGAQQVAVHVGDHPGGWRVTVVDDGTGFDVQHAAESGAGAGLANMRDRLDAIGGSLEVESLPGLGTTVTAVVPGHQAERRPGRAVSGPVG